MGGDRKSDVAPDAATVQDGPGPTAVHGVTLPDAGRGEVGRLAPGHRLERYEIIGMIGRGGMGEVYAAHDVLLDRIVAVKVLLADNTDAAGGARLVREAQALARLQHANVVAVFDAGEDHGLVFLAMQYVEGETLAAHLQGRSPTWREVVDLYIAAGRGLAAAHAAGIIHRDFKPANVLVDRAGKVAVTDFGVARAAAGETPPPQPIATRPVAGAGSSLSDRIPGRTPLQELTHQGALVGTPHYMAREQFYGSTASSATDQYAFCVSLWEGLFHTHPYLPANHDGTLFAFAAAIESGILRLPRKHDVPRRVVAAISRGLDKDPTKRWPSMDALLAELARVVMPRRWPWIAAGASFLAVGVAAAVLLARQADDPPGCDVSAEQRIAVVWGSSHAAAVQRAFVGTGRSFATAIAPAIVADLDAYARAWRQAATDACIAARRDAITPERAKPRLDCVDRAHAALAATIATFTTQVEGVVVDNARAAVDKLPRLGECAEGGSGGPEPPPAIAKRLAVVEPRLEAAIARFQVGQLKAAQQMFVALREEARDVAWEPFQLRVAYYIAFTATRLDLDHATGTEIAVVARRAATIGAHRLAFDAWLAAMRLPANDAALDEAVAAATAAATALRGSQPTLQITLAQGTGLARLRHWERAASLCRDGLAAATASGWETIESDALDCLVEALLPLGRYGELEPIVERDIAIKTARYGADHPAIADLLVFRASVLEKKGKTEETKAALTRALEIRTRTYGEKDVRVAMIQADLADLYNDAGDIPKAIEMTEQALANIQGVQPPPDHEISELHRNLGVFYMNGGDHEGTRRHFELALDHAKRAHGERSLEVGFLLLMYGQYQTAWDVEVGIKNLHAAIELLDVHKDARGLLARAALANILERKGRARQALPLLEAAVAGADVVNTPPMLLGQMHFSLARAIVATKGDRRRARELADDAITYMAKAGSEHGRTTIQDWMRQHKLRPEPRQ